ncbi:interleukin-5 receptor subunit alpha [Ambystoma mexicanum]|uniref:interleukin-5 receptor subunit alpha n=1 Tax=Ambystoma mexicanum TaxID=8296 RepID=UPI0037E8EDF0
MADGFPRSSLADHAVSACTLLALTEQCPGFTRVQCFSEAEALLICESTEDLKTSGYVLDGECESEHKKLSGKKNYVKYETSNNRTRRTLSLNGGLLARVATILYTNGTNVERSQSVEALLPPRPGNNCTSVTNLMCVTYVDFDNAVCLNCTWIAGKNAPRDTKYFLFYRYSKFTEECQQYILNVQDETHMGCNFVKTKIKIMRGGTLIIFVNGSSDNAIIQPFYKLFDTDFIEKIHPPRNVELSQQDEFLEIQWKIPYSSFPNRCFKYEVKISDLKTGKEEVKPSDNNRTNIFRNVRSRHSVQVRAKGRDACRDNPSWSEWSEPAFTVEDHQDGMFILTISLSLALFVLGLILAIVFRRFHVCRKMFPPIPSPESTLKQVFIFPENGKTRGESQESEVISYVEELYSEKSPGCEDLKVALMLRK